MSKESNFLCATNHGLFCSVQEFFVECLSKEAYSYTSQSKKKTVQKRDVERAIDAVDALAFLEGILDS
jgi:DNA polymerase epsilon subunit 4